MEFKEVFKMNDENYDEIQFIYRKIITTLMTLVGTIGTAFNWPPTAIILTVWGALYLAVGQSLSIASEE